MIKNKILNNGEKMFSAKKRLTISFILLSLIFISFGFLISCEKSEPVNETAAKVQPPEWSYNKSIYEVNIRQYTDEGTFKAFDAHLPRLKDMGVGIIWFMPIHPIGEVNRKGTLGSYYSVKDYKGVNPEFGTLNDFKETVRKAHELGMYVILDWVANHSAFDNPLTETDPDFYTRDSLGNLVPPVDDWWDVADFNYDNPEMREYMIGALKYWIEECNIDGYRCDVAAMVPLDFWQKARIELDKIKTVFMLAEAGEPEMHDDAFDMTYNWQLKDVMNSIAAGDKDASAIAVHFKEEAEQYPADAFRMTFTTNHDENTWQGTVFERLGDGTEAFGVLTCVVPGMPLVYSGQEAGLDKRLDFFEKDPITWKPHKFYDVYKKLFELKKKNKALRNGDRGGLSAVLNVSDSAKVFAFTREKDGDKVTAIFNFSDEEVEFKLSGEPLAGRYKNIMSEEPVTLSASEKMKLGAWDYVVLAGN